MGSLGTNKNIKVTESLHAPNLPWNKREDYLKTLGFSDRDAELLSQVLPVYIQNPNRVSNYTNLIDSFIQKSPKFTGTVFRGIVTDKEYKVGDTLAENKISSWTSEQQVAREYSGSADYESQNAWNIGKGQHAVIFVAENVGGTSISRFHGAGKEKYHKEVITPSSNQYIISRVEKRTEGRRDIEVQYVYVKRR